MQSCPKCGKENIDMAKFCIACGTALAMSPISVFATQQSLSHPIAKKQSNNARLILLAIVLLAGLGTGAYFIFLTKKKETDKANNKNVDQSVLISDSVLLKPVDSITLQPAESKAFEYNYVGKIGSFPIHMQFVSTGTVDCPRGGSTFEGWYYYDSKGAENKMKITGQCCGASISFFEYNDKGISTGNFSGLWGGTQIDGNWMGNGHNYDFHLISIN